MLVPDDAEPVPRDEVIRAWLTHERRKRDETVDTGLSPGEAFDALLTANPAAAFFWRDAPVTCYRLVLSREQFDRLHVVPGPEGMLWQALSPDGTVRGCAERIDCDDPDRLARETGVDVPRVESLAASVPPVEGPLVLSTRRGAVPWHVMDGNHRAAAIALSLRRGTEYVPVPVYLCVGSNSVLEPLVQRVGGLFRQLRRRDPKTQ